MVWADNIYILSTSVEQLQDMITDVTKELESENVHWESSALQVMAALCVTGQQPTICAKVHDDMFAIEANLVGRRLKLRVVPI